MSVLRSAAEHRMWFKNFGYTPTVSRPRRGLDRCAVTNDPRASVNAWAPTNAQGDLGLGYCPLNGAITFKALMVGLLCGVGSSQAALSQRSRLGPRSSWADSTPARILSMSSTDFPLAVVIEVLRQRHQAYPLAKRPALAAAVLSRAVSDPKATTKATEAIAMSGSSDRGIEGVPDPEATDHLITLHKNLSNESARLLALEDLIDQVEPARALPYLADVAASRDDEQATSAILEMRRLAFATPTASQADRLQARAALRQLSDKGRLPAWHANVELCEVALAQAWPTGDHCRNLPP